jgi:tetratricopeptide (TPR) repeat protein
MVGDILSTVSVLGPVPVSEAIAQCEDLLSHGMSDRLSMCGVMCALARLKAMSGDLEAARKLYRQGRALLRDLGQGVHAASTAADLVLVELHGGDLALAEREARADYEFLAKMGETYYLSTIASLLARVVRDQGRHEEAMALTEAAEAATGEDDFTSQALWRATRAPLLARLGRHAEAEAIGLEAVELVRKTEAPSLLADALVELGDAMQIAGQVEPARAAYTEALDLFTAKGNLVSIDTCSKRLAALQPATP